MMDFQLDRRGFDSAPGHHFIEDIFPFNKLSPTSVLRLPDCPTNKGAQQMLFRVARPMKRKSSRSAYFVQRIPAEIKSKIVGQDLAIPFGDSVKFVTPTARAQAISFSLRTDDPVRVKILQATIAAHLEAIWQALIGLTSRFP